MPRNAGGVPAGRLPPFAARPFDMAKLRTAAAILREKKNVLILLGDRALEHGPQQHAARIQAKTGCRLMAELINGLQARGAGAHSLGSAVSYPAAMAMDRLKDVEHIICVGSRAPVGFFAYPGVPSHHAPDSATVTVLAQPGHDMLEALDALAQEVGAPRTAVFDFGRKPAVPKGLPSSEGFGELLGAVLPEQAIVVDEAITFGTFMFPGSYAAAPRLDDGDRWCHRLRHASRHGCRAGGQRTPRPQHPG